MLFSHTGTLCYEIILITQLVEMALLKKVLLASILAGVFLILYTKYTHQIPQSSTWEDRSLRTVTTALNRNGKPAFFPAFQVQYYKFGSRDSSKFYKEEKYYQSGTLAERGTFDNQGLKHGDWEQWYEDGQKALKESYHHGIKHGTMMTWLQDGSLSERLKFDSGQIINVVE